MTLTKIPYQNGFIVVSDEKPSSNTQHFLWKDEIHRFHSFDVFGIKTTTKFKSKDSSYLTVSEDGILGVVLYQSEPFVEGVPLAVEESDVEAFADKYFDDAFSSLRGGQTNTTFRYGWRKHLRAGYNHRASTHPFNRHHVNKIAEWALRFGYIPEERGEWDLFYRDLDQFIESLQSYEVETSGTDVQGRTIIKRKQ